jgi:hypothetical protein
MNAMNGKKFLAKSWMTAFVAVAFACLTSAATAEIVSTEQALQQSDREQELLNRAEVENGLKTLGVAPADTRQRVDAMTPEEVRTVAGRMDTLAVGGEASKTDWIIILLGVIVIILLV